MRIRKRFVTSLVVAWAISGAGLSVAQPAANNQPKGPNPGLQPGVPAGPDWGRMTPEQRQQAVLQMIDQTLRGSLVHLGYADKALQDAVVAHATTQEQILEPVRERHRKVAQSLLYNTASDKDVAILMNELSVALEEAKARREDAIAALDEKIGFSQKPRLAALLSMMGLTGEETSFIGGVVGSMTGTWANLAVGWAQDAARRQTDAREKGQ